MTESRLSTPAPIGDELLSAYIDGQLNAAEYRRVEKALATDAQVQERYQTLRMTVNLMQNAPPVRVPRAFALSEAQVLAAGGKVKGVKQPGFFERLFPRLMPLATAAVALLLIVLVSVDLAPGFTGGTGAPQPAMQKMDIAAAPMQDEAAAMEMPAEAVAEEMVEMATNVESTVLVEKEVIATVLVGELAKREGAKPSSQEATTAQDSVTADEAPAARAAAKIRSKESTPMPRPTRAVAEAPMAAAPPPEPEGETAADEVEPMLEGVGGSAESFGEESSAQAVQPAESAPAGDIAQVTPPEEGGRKPTWLRPLEFLLALLFVCLLAATLLLHKRTRADTP